MNPNEFEDFFNVFLPMVDPGELSEQILKDFEKMAWHLQKLKALQQEFEIDATVDLTKLQFTQETLDKMLQAKFEKPKPFNRRIVKVKRLNGVTETHILLTDGSMGKAAESATVKLNFGDKVIG